MTLSSTTNRVSYVGNDVTTAFAFNFLTLAEDDLKVILVTDSTGVEVVQTLTTHYTITGEGTTAITVTMVTAPATGETLVIIREEQLTQGLDLIENDPFPSDLVEQQFDRQTMMSQQIDTELKRAFKLSDGDTSGADTTLPTPVALKTFRWDAAGTALEQIDDPGVSAAAAAVSAAAALVSENAASASASAASTSETNAAASAAAAAASAATIDLTAPGEIGGVTAAVGNFTDVNLSGDVVLDSGQGVDFSATSDATGMTSELLDDYEEGVYTATVVCSTSGGYTVSSANDQIAYTKVGRLVHINGQLNVDGESSPSGSLRINLPFVASSLSEGAGNGKFSVQLQNHGDAGIENVFGLLVDGVAYFQLQNITDAGITEAIDESRVDTNFHFYFSFSYTAT